MILRGSVSPQHRPAITRSSGTMLERVAYVLESELNRSEAAERGDHREERTAKRVSRSDSRPESLEQY
jgi:hypothetical protein